MVTAFVADRHWLRWARIIPPAVCLAAAPAAAQETHDFSGFRVEALAGWDNSGLNFDDDVFEDGRQSQDGFFYGIGAGYDFATGGAVFGAEAEFSDATSGSDGELDGVGPNGSLISANVENDIGSDIYLGVRAGAVVSRGILVYGKVGYTHTSLQIDGNGASNGVPFTLDDKVNIDGFRVGAGVEVALAGNLYGKAEYRYSRYSNAELQVEGPDVDLNSSFDAIDVDRHQVVVGVGLRF